VYHTGRKFFRTFVLQTKNTPDSSFVQNETVNTGTSDNSFNFTVVLILNEPSVRSTLKSTEYLIHIGFKTEKETRMRGTYLSVGVAPLN
jgi:hypothetical protein